VITRPGLSDESPGFLIWHNTQSITGNMNSEPFNPASILQREDTVTLKTGILDNSGYGEKILEMKEEGEVSK
jgi:hypothetical protein